MLTLYFGARCSAGPHAVSKAGAALREAGRLLNLVLELGYLALCCVPCHFPKTTTRKAQSRLYSPPLAREESLLGASLIATGRDAAASSWGCVFLGPYAATTFLRVIGRGRVLGVDSFAVRGRAVPGPPIPTMPNPA